MKNLQTKILLIAALSMLVLFTACPNTAGGGTGTGGGGTLPTPGPCVKVPYADLETYLRDTASIEKLNYIEVIGEILAEAFKGSDDSSPAPGALGQKLQDHSDKKVPLKSQPTPQVLPIWKAAFTPAQS
ncbi:hypothetical protein [Treponema pedis]|uniref:hypothetical protein n=1 Tax=Treponema pedis TaxID=409322 RepID=UPI00040A0B5C|nr:hypothetical protein [Treponema pedis]